MAAVAALRRHPAARVNPLNVRHTLEGALAEASRRQQTILVCRIWRVVVSRDRRHQAAAIDVFERKAGTMASNGLAISIEQLRIRLTEASRRTPIAFSQRKTCTPCADNRNTGSRSEGVLMLEKSPRLGALPRTLFQDLWLMDQSPLTRSDSSAALTAMTNRSRTCLKAKVTSSIQVGPSYLQHPDGYGRDLLVSRKPSDVSSSRASGSLSKAQKALTAGRGVVRSAR